MKTVSDSYCESLSDILRAVAMRCCAISGSFSVGMEPAKPRMQMAPDGVIIGIDKRGDCPDAHKVLFKIEAVMAFPRDFDFINEAVDVGDAVCGVFRQAFFLQVNP